MDKKPLFFIIFFCLICLGIGLASQIYLGDEPFHFRLARIFFETGSRPVTDEMYSDVPKLSFLFGEATFWHMLLALLWRLTGGVSAHFVQIYQIGYAVILLVSVYLLTKTLFDRKQALFALLLVMTAPIIVLFSVVLYLDLPLTALSVLSFQFLAKRKFFLAGIILGIMVLTKVNALFLAPAVLVVASFNSFSSSAAITKIKNILAVLLPALIINIPDIWFRLTKLGYLYYTQPHPANNIAIFSYSPSALNSKPSFFFAYFGLFIPLGFIAYCVRQRKLERKELILWLPIASYLFFWFILFRNILDVRYLIVILPFISILAAKPIDVIGSKKALRLIIVVALLQFLAVGTYVYYKRQIPPGIRQGYLVVREHVPKGKGVMYPGVDMAMYANRPIAWGTIRTISDLFWGKDEETMLAVLRDYRIDYIAINKGRIYDDTSIRHISGYPLSFVKRLPDLSFLKQIYENQDFSLWEVIKVQ